MDDENEDELFEGIRIIEPDDPEPDQARPGRSVFDEPADDVADPEDEAPAAAWRDEDEDDDLEAWSSLTDASPRWRDEEVEDLPPVAPPQTVGAEAGVDEFFAFDDEDDAAFADFDQRTSSQPAAAWVDDDPAAEAVPVVTAEREREPAGRPQRPAPAAGWHHLPQDPWLVRPQAA